MPATYPYPEPDQCSPYPTSHFLKIHLNIILPLTPGSPKWSLSHRFPHQHPIYASPLPHTTTCHSHLILLDFITQTILGEEYRLLSSSFCSFLHSLVTLSLLGPNIILNTLFSNILNLRSSLNVSDQVSHPYTTTGKIIVSPGPSLLDECFINMIRFYGGELLAPHPTPKLEDHLLSAVHDYLFNIFAATLHIGGPSSIRNMRTCHAMVTGTHLSL